MSTIRKAYKRKVGGETSSIKEKIAIFVYDKDGFKYNNERWESSYPKYNNSS